ncbi:aliphatic sulfonate ABC transporter substrate-binding protein [Paenibacillus sp. GCM10027627]|uniref:aliphatic sulfonate ABC transporter substrate-binding protein n=1 Tax=unclassified Paenibacillus TaxID=185978 RepID=UPI00362B36DC
MYYNPKRKNRTLFTVFMVIMFAILLAACSESAAPAKQSEPVTVHVAINGGTNLFAIIKDKGWLTESFKKLSANVEWSEFPSGPPLLESLAAGRVDISLLGDGAALQGQSAGLPFVNIGLISKGVNLNSILLPIDSSIQSVADLKGKQIAVAKGTTSHVYLIKLLEKNELAESDVAIVNLQYTDGLPAFLSGQVDGWVTVDPFITQLTLENKAVVLSDGEANILAPVTLIAHSTFAEKHPELVTAFLDVYKKALAWQAEHLDESAALLAESKKIPVPIMKTVLSEQHPELSPISEAEISTQQASADILVKTGFLKKEIAYADYVDNSFVNGLAD